MNRTRLIIVGASIGLLAGIAIRATFQLGKTRAALSDITSQTAALRGKIATTENRLRAGNATRPESNQESAAPREEHEPGDVSANAAPSPIANSAEPESTARRDNPFAAILNDPIRRAAYFTDFRASLDFTYGGVFKELGLTAETIAKFKDNRVAARLGWIEFRAIADAHELGWNTAGREALRREQIKLNATQLAEVFGPLRPRWGQYTSTQNVRDLVQRLASTGAYLSTPVTSAQVERATDILIANGTPREKNPFRGYAINWKTASVQLPQVLSPPQIATLELFVQEQEAGVKVAQRIKQLSADFKGQR